MDSCQSQSLRLFEGSSAFNRLENLPYDDKMRNRIEAYHSSFLTMYIQYHKTEHQDTTPITVLSLPPSLSDHFDELRDECSKCCDVSRF